MRTLNLTFLLVFFTLTAFAQVGIGTTSPHPGSMLDVNGTLRIRDLTLGSNNAAKDSILVIDGRGFVYRIPTRDLLANMDKSLVKATFSGGNSINISLGSGETNVVYNNEVFDIKNEYNPTTGAFTAEDDGIYRIGTLLRYSTTISLATTTVRIYKNSTMVAEGFTSNAREYKFDFLTSLNAGDVISVKFYLSGLSVSLGLLTGEKNAYLNIEQVR